MGIQKFVLSSLIILATIHVSAASSKPQQASSNKLAFEQALAGNGDALFQNIKSKKTDLNQTNEYGQTLLIVAASAGNIEIVKKLIAEKVDFNLKDNEKNSALYYAITNEESATAAVLIEAGANLENLNELQDSALTLATSLNDSGNIKLILAKEAKLIDKANKEGKTPLMEAARHGSKETIQILLNANADKDLKNSLGRTALDIAKKAQNPDAIKLLAPKK